MLLHGEGQSLRQVLPLCFFRLPVPDGMPPWTGGALVRSGESAASGVFRACAKPEPSLYVLCVPARQSPHETLFFTAEALADEPSASGSPGQ